jgi:carbamoyl-phosphate synthase small subunit
LEANSVQHPAILALEDGTLFEGQAIGHLGHATGEVVFNTSMTGYQEILTDPSYAEQIITLTYPHIGNVGTNQADNESDRVFAKGLVIRDLPDLAYNWRQEFSLSHFLKSQKVVAISEIDTRELTRILREKGALRGCIMAGEIEVEKAFALARACPSLKAMDLAKVVSCTAPYYWSEGTWSLPSAPVEALPEPRFHVVALDYGIKQNILRLLVQSGCKVTVVPAQTTAAEILAHKPDGVFLSNGPGDPEPCDYAIAMIREMLKIKMPIYGICLGHQLLGLALGAKTFKMKFGHHGANHPVKDLKSGRVWITAQNHGFAIDPSTLNPQMEVTHLSLFDDSIQGIRATQAPAFSFQGHPEASPGPHDALPLFDAFIQAMQATAFQHESLKYAETN